MRIKHTLLLPLVLAAAVLSGCVTSTPPATFDLVSAAASVKVRNIRSTIVVAEPTTVQALGTERLAVMSEGGEISYLPDAQLTDTLPRLVQTKMVQSFENSGFSSVGRPGDRLSPDVTIVTEIRSFEIRTTGGTRAVVELTVKLLNEANGRVFATRVFRSEKPTATKPASRATGALDQALGEVMTEMVAWAAKKL